MNTINKIHLTIIAFINIILVSLMIRAAWQGNDKAILIILVFYPILTLLNAIVWLILLLFKRQEARLYKWNMIGMIVLFIPALIIAGMY